MVVASRQVSRARRSGDDDDRVRQCATVWRSIAGSCNGVRRGGAAEVSGRSGGLLGGGGEVAAARYPGAKEVILGHGGDGIVVGGSSVVRTTR